MQRKSTSTVENLGRETCNDLLVLTVLRLFSGTLEHSDLFGSFFFSTVCGNDFSVLVFFFFLNIFLLQHDILSHVFPMGRNKSCTNRMLR